MPYTLPSLPYDYNALEPHVDEQTMRIHHTKHHQGYVDKANGALAGTSFDGLPVEQVLARITEVPETIRTTVRNNAGGHANHSIFWQIMKPQGGGAPTGELADAINGAFGSFESFKERFGATATARFGSGWAWLVVAKAGGLSLYSTANQDSPFMDGDAPVLGLDVWEHAYYLKYQNRRADYIQNWWNVVNWEKVGELFLSAR
jgi:Fe-Mn family superoxide dismutase